jgi:3D (Asp-Asp-Asp) domain-containing protein
MRQHQNNTKTHIKVLIIIIILLISLVLFYAPNVIANDEVTVSDSTVQTIQDYKPTIKVKQYHKTDVKISWSTNKNTNKYVVYRNNKKIKTTTHKHYIDKKRYTQRYTYKVKAYNTTFKVYSKYSKTKSICLYKKKFKVKAYAYSGGGTCANGQSVQRGRIATDPRVIKTGSWLYVNGYGLCKACDTGGDIKGKVVDLYMNSNAECNRWGVKYPKVYILK